jgi:hypothetical protein
MFNIFNIFKKKPLRVMTEEEEAEEIMLRLTFPEVFSRMNEGTYRSVGGLDIEQEIRNILRAELDARGRY